MKKFIYPAKLYLAAFLALLLGLYTLLNTNLYQQADKIRQNALHLNSELAQSELIQAINNALLNVNDALNRIIEAPPLTAPMTDQNAHTWYQDLNREARTKRYLGQLALYDLEGKRLSRSTASQPDRLPNTVPKVHQYFLFHQNQLHLIIIKPIFLNTTGALSGYIGQSIAFLPLLKQFSHFMHIDAQSLQVAQAIQPGQISLSNITHAISFDAYQNPMNDYLWELIQDFLYEVIFFSLIMVLFFGFFFSRFTLFPLKALTHYLEKLQQQPNKILPPIQSTFHFSEFENLKQAIYSYHKQLVSAHIEIDEQHQIAYEQARQDPLSHVFNRRAFDEAWDYLLFNYHLNPKNVAFILFDCDFFKAINDTYGHEVGDDVIRISASTFKRALPLEFNIYRIGGDEFASLIEGKTQQEVIQIAQQCYRAISEYDFKHLGIQEKVSYSIGLCFITPEQVEELPFMHKYADIALYQAKKTLNNKVQIYQLDQHQPEQVLVSNQRITRIVDALLNGTRIEMHKQTIYTTNQTPVYFESLIRIKEDEGLIYPDEIFKVVGHRRLETELDKRVIECLTQHLKDGSLESGMGLSINLSAQTLLQENLVELLAPIQPFLAQHPVVIEILEDTLIHNLTEVTDTLNILREQGFKVALDDFGSGYSSIRYLAQMPVDIVKFDISLTQSLIREDKTSIIVHQTAAMIRAAGYKLVMEGIETEAMLNAALAAGATHLQGYYFGKPEPFK